MCTKIQNCDECGTITPSPYYINQSVKLCTDCYVKENDIIKASEAIELDDLDEQL